ncbi:uncharacterized protein HGUI_01431 [Hanseniaspora guilliermondii]|uniref:Mannosyltransferase n=1 Tax=Hanseniaspora guilliermondii TaxID=56406 RepID=A0A1L0CWM4_9ASCO|nr:uncharacterized protein HGUI_01431 [Hanseniaspora guilliermondii]
MYKFHYSTWFLTSLNVVLIPLTNSYIHPDEHYQSLEPLLKFINNGLDEKLNNGSITWEYSTSSNFPIRSITILRIYYELLVRKIVSLNPYDIIITIKYYNLAIFIGAYLLFSNSFMTNRFNYNVSKVLILSSYTLLSYQVRSFSNSIETVLLMLFLVFLNSNSFIILGLLFTLGIFNRLTFPLWIILPCAYKAYHIFKKETKKKMFVYAIGLLLSLLFAFISITYMDSFVYFECKRFVLTPLENWMYNSNPGNLAKHGIHSRMNHFLINFPTLVSPFILIFAALHCGNKIFIKNKLPLLTCLSGLLFLSLFPHQEARFIIPCIPLFYSSLDFEYMKAKYHASSSITKMLTKIIILGHAIFSIVMLILMGNLHQSGLINLTNKPAILSNINNSDFIFWHTLMPLHWPFYLKIKDRSSLFIHFVEDRARNNGFRELSFETDLKDAHHIFDFMGVDTNNFVHLINDIKQKKKVDLMSIILVTPSRFTEELKTLDCEYNVVDHFSYHLNLNDGFDKSPFGLDVLRVIL